MLDDRVKSGEGVEPWMDTAPAQRLDLYGIAFEYSTGVRTESGAGLLYHNSENRLQNLQKKRLGTLGVACIVCYGHAIRG